MIQYLSFVICIGGKGYFRAIVKYLFIPLQKNVDIIIDVLMFKYV